MVTADRRQLWINGTTKWCPHKLLDEVRSEGGAVIAELCRACGFRVAEYGKCDGCGRECRLVKFVLSKRKRYHSEGCLSAANAKAREEKEAKDKAAAADVAKGFPK